MSLVTEDALMLRTELPSPGVELGRKGIDMPEMDEAADACPLRVKSMSVWLEDGLRSGKRALAIVTISLGDTMRTG
jgi:hypothetical protein